MKRAALAPRPPRDLPNTRSPCRAPPPRHAPRYAPMACGPRTGTAAPHVSATQRLLVFSSRPRPGQDRQATRAVAIWPRREPSGDRLDLTAPLMPAWHGSCDGWALDVSLAPVRRFGIFFFCVARTAGEGKALRFPAPLLAFTCSVTVRGFVTSCGCCVVALFRTAKANFISTT